MLATRSHNYPWNLTAPGSFTQEYDSFQSVQVSWNKVDDEERRLHLLGSYVQIESNIPDLETRLRKAWLTARYFHPGIAIRLEEYYKSYNVPTDDELNAWLNKTFLEAPCDTAEEFQRKYIGNEPQPQLYWFHKTKELLIIAHHTLFDAGGLWLFWESYLELVASPKTVRFGDEWKNLPFARDDLLGLPRYPSLAAYTKGLEVIMDCLKPEVVELPTLNTRISSDGQIITNGKSHNGFLRVVLPPDQSMAIVQSCKHRGVSITSAVFVALALTCRKFQSEYGKAGRYAACFHNFDSRPWFSKEAAKLCNAGNDPHAMIPFAIDLENKDFDEILVSTDEKFRSLRTEFGKDPAGLDALSLMLKGLLDLNGPVATFPGFTSFGVGDRIIKTAYNDEAGNWIKIVDTYHWIHNMVKGMNAVCIYSWKGRMILGGCFNEAWHSEDMFRRLFQESFDLLLCKFDLKQEKL
ncbi:hypothetical protein EYC84_010288 [Monilinia fructicola]|uniref:Condensation domain-containing protein n=2 Tax=Monilinia fructicola TaxID=38448 RepID=A0A5M9JDA6_MONFR|nr:hypothetical protein EYC84_010288 [Monilinia fructicola]